MTTPRGTRKTTKTAPKAEPVKEEVKEQTPDEEVLENPQPVEEATVEAVPAKEEATDKVEAVPAKEEATDKVEAVSEDEETSYKVRIIKGGLMVSGRVLKAGTVVALSEDLYNQSEKDQREYYGDVFFEKA